MLPLKLAKLKWSFVSLNVCIWVPIPPSKISILFRFMTSSAK
ncbi:MAG: hypothetical protein ACTS46_00160 [Candidatus Hodgkinia cicadicola]